MAETVTLQMKKNLLKKQVCFAELTDMEIEALSGLLLERSYKTGEVVVLAGDPVDSVYFILSGSADIRKEDEEGQLQTICSLASGDTIGLTDSGFYSLSGERTATVVATTPLMVLRLSIATFHGFALTFPHVKEVMRKNAEAFLHITRSYRAKTPSSVTK